MILSFKPQFKKPILNKVKIHSIREDKNSRWRAGMQIHLSTGVRTNQYNCFARATCMSTQRIDIKQFANVIDDLPAFVIIDGRFLSKKEIQVLAYNDGFNSIEEFFEWFKDGLNDGTLIHWTTYKY